MKPQRTVGVAAIEHGEEPLSSGAQPTPFVRRMLLRASATAIMQAFSSFIGFVVAVALARLLGARGYGSYAFTVAWASALTIPAGLGLNKFVVRVVARYEVRERWDYMR